MSPTKKYTWNRVAETVENIDWQSNGMCIVELGGKKLSVALFRDELYAFAYKCPHAGGIMAHGFIDESGKVVCQLHRYKFDMTNGRNTSGEGYYLQTYLIEARKEGIFIGIEDRGFLNRI